MGDPDRHLLLARAALATGEAGRARAELKAGLAACVGPSPVRTRLLIETAKIVILDADPKPAVAAARTAYAAACETRTDEAQADLVLGRALYISGSNDCRLHYRRARRAARQNGDVETYLDAAMGTTSSLHLFKRVDKALVAAHAVQRAAEREDRRIWIDSARWQQARYRFMASGDPERAVRELGELADAPGIGAGRPHLLAETALALADAGRLEEARRVLRRLDRRAETGWDRAVRAFYGSEVEWTSGRPARALAAAEDGIQHGVFVTAVLIRLTRLWSLFELGRPEADPELERAGTWPLTQFAVLTSRAFGSLASADLEGAEALLLAAAASAEATLLREGMRARWGAAEIARRRGAGERAREALVQLELRASAAGLVYLLPRIRRSLRDLETRPRKRSTEHALTRREREVLAGAADGLSSRQIALRLGIAVSTVETHVQSAMHKLGARTRRHAAQLAGLAHRMRPVDPDDERLLELLDEGASVSEAARALGISRSTATRRLRALRS